ncbi:MAG: hypothetical protein Pg6C_11180 [Treponemataceae bacterium]|nr:MAG: hypothetical protein Pg6C_11180 [Treponemataceae bacterium]
MNDIILIIILVALFLIWLEWQIGKAIGKHVTKSAGLVLGILGIVIFPFFLGGIACIVYSSKNTDVITVNIPGNADPPNPDSASSGDTRECPYCAEIIKKKATICRFCGKEIEADSSPVPVQSAEIPPPAITEEEDAKRAKVALVMFLLTVAAIALILFLARLF